MHVSMILFNRFLLLFSRGMNELKNLQYLPRTSEPRETMVEDRTRCHADHVGHGFDRFTTAAVGLLKAVNCGERYVVDSGYLSRIMRKPVFGISDQV